MKFSNKSATNQTSITSTNSSVTNQTSCLTNISTVQGPPGRNGQDGAPGQDGPVGAPGMFCFLLCTVKVKLRECR